MQTEIELRSLISKAKYAELMDYFKKHGEHIGEEFQQTYYFDCEPDLRIQKSNNYSKIWLKSGKLHDEVRDELEIFCRRDDFEKLSHFFQKLGFNIEIRWSRKRHKFKWQGINVMLDHTEGYGYIIELEKITSDTDALKQLKEKMAKLKIDPTPKKVFDTKFEDYKKKLISQ